MELYLSFIFAVLLICYLNIYLISEKTKDVSGITILGKNSENLGACYILVENLGGELI